MCVCVCVCEILSNIYSSVKPPHARFIRACFGFGFFKVLVRHAQIR